MWMRRGIVYTTSGGCSDRDTHIRLKRMSTGRFIRRSSTVARPVAVRPMIVVASSIQAK